MIPCPSCEKPLPEGSRFCPSCGAASATAHEDVSASATATRALGERAASPPSPLRSSSGHGESRFIPGAMIAGRYRVLSLLGRGGMGEVYRADDLKLGQPVALKFLPESIGAEASKLDRFFNEVRIARQVSHPNVCRVYDIGEVDGHHYLSMEYIDGEDLASLLRRIGRLPGDKAVEIARQLCAGLAAAHDKGVLHRDLKPANVMIDGRGRARITDFGLAGLAEEIQGAEIRSGTPAYMAPEQLEGREVSVRSDVYALGLVLYEIFTGKPAFDAPSLDALMKLHRTSSVATPSSITREMDPAVERVILRCLEKDPAQRPPSALAVAAALPGGDPLAAALAAGETPSPEMVAAAGEVGALRPVTAGLVLGGLIVLLVAVGLLSPRVTMLGKSPVAKPPEVLAEKARELLDASGYTTPPADSAFGFGTRGSILRWIEKEDSSPGRWDRLSHPLTLPMAFWYRESPRKLVALGPGRVVGVNDPPATVSGMATLIMDTEGRLVGLDVVTPEVEENVEALAAGPDWDRLLEAAGVDAVELSPAEPEWTPPVFSDRRAAWSGELPGGGKLRVEAASYKGRPVHFEVLGPWARPGRDLETEQRSGARFGQALFIFFLLVILGGAIYLARRNLLAGSGDRKGATRLGLYVLIVAVAEGLLSAHHVPEIGAEWTTFALVISLSLFQAGLIWLLYIALEPFVRRRWPEGIVAWSRLLAGGFRNPLVGRDVLVGLLAGALSLFVQRLHQLAPILAKVPGPVPVTESVKALLGFRMALAAVLESHLSALTFAFILMAFFFLGRMHGPKWYYTLIFFGIFTLMNSLFTTGNVPLRVAFSLLQATIFTGLFYRFGFLAVISAVFVEGFPVPLGFDFSLWYTSSTLFAWVLLTALAAAAAYVSVGHRRAPAPAGASA